MKKILAIVLVVFMLLGLTACGSTANKPGDSAANSSPNTDGPQYDKLKLNISYATGDTGMDGVTAIKFEQLKHFAESF